MWASGRQASQRSAPDRPRVLVHGAGLGGHRGVGEDHPLRGAGRAAGGHDQRVAVGHRPGSPSRPRPRSIGADRSPGAPSRARRPAGGGQAGVDRQRRVAASHTCAASRRRPVPPAGERGERGTGGGYGPAARGRTQGDVMQGLMQDRPLTLPHFFDRAERLFPEKESSPPRPPGASARTYGEWAERTRRLGGVLDDARHLRRRPGGAPSRWNTARHLELYFAAPCSGRVLHTLNIRLFPEQLTYIVNHAEDEVDLRRPVARRAAVAAARRRSRRSSTSW